MPNIGCGKSWCVESLRDYTAKGNLITYHQETGSKYMSCCSVSAYPFFATPLMLMLFFRGIINWNRSTRYDEDMPRAKSLHSGVRVPWSQAILKSVLQPSSIQLLVCLRQY